MYFCCNLCRVSALTDNFHFCIKGKAYLPSNIIATSGDAFQCTRKYFEIISAIRYILKNGNFVDFQLYPPFDKMLGIMIIRAWSGEYMAYKVFK